MTKSWFSISNLSDGNAEVNIYDEIGLWGITAKDFLDQLKAVGDRRITLRINSPGGSVFDGTAIYNRLKDHAAGVEVKIDGLAASIASVIAMAGSKITMAENALLMIHNASGIVMGNAEDMRQLADTLDKIDGTIAGTYSRKTGAPVEDMAALMDAETWFTAAEAKAAGFIDEIDEPLALAAKFSGTVQNHFKHAPTPEPPAPSEAEQLFTAALTQIDAQKTELATVSAQLAEQGALLTARTAERDALQAKVAEHESAATRQTELLAKLKAARGLVAAAVVPPVQVENEAEVHGGNVAAKLAAITDPAERRAFFKQHEALIHATNAKLKK